MRPILVVKGSVEVTPSNNSKKLETLAVATKSRRLCI
jgi:hypothetical protein